MAGRHSPPHLFSPNSPRHPPPRHWHHQPLATNPHALRLCHRPPSHQRPPFLEDRRLTPPRAPTPNQPQLYSIQAIRPHACHQQTHHAIPADRSSVHHHHPD